MIHNSLDVAQADEEVATFLMRKRAGPIWLSRSFGVFWGYSAKQEFRCTDLESSVSFVCKWKHKAWPLQPLSLANAVGLFIPLLWNMPWTLLLEKG